MYSQERSAGSQISSAAAVDPRKWDESIETSSIGALRDSGIAASSPIFASCVNNEVH